MSEKAKGHKLERRGDGQIGTPWVYSVDRPVATVLENGFFDTVNSNLLVGDSVRVLWIDGRVIEMIDLMVTVRDGNHVVVEKIDSIISFNAQKKKAEKLPPEPDEEFINGDGEVRWNLGRQMHEVLVDGKVIAASKDKAIAQAIARGDAPLSN